MINLTPSVDRFCYHRGDGKEGKLDVTQVRLTHTLLLEVYQPRCLLHFLIMLNIFFVFVFFLTFI